MPLGTRKTFSFLVREQALERTNHMCQMNCGNRAFDFHHGVENTKLHNKKWPLFVQSEYNCYPVCRDCHTPGILKQFRRTEIQCDEIEKQLQQEKRGN